MNVIKKKKKLNLTEKLFYLYIYVNYTIVETIVPNKNILLYINNYCKYYKR